MINGDILDYPISRLRGFEHLKVVGNLPYNISSPIIIYLIENRSCIDAMFISLQKEFACRLIAGPGSREYGAISCFVQFYARPRILFNIKKGVFYPVPKVDSSFLKIAIEDRTFTAGKNRISNGLYLTDEEKLFKIIRTCFGKRRKTILNSLYPVSGAASKEELSDRLKRAGVSPGRRPETISLEEFISLTKAL